MWDSSLDQQEMNGQGSDSEALFDFISCQQLLAKHIYSS